MKVLILVLMEYENTFCFIAGLLKATGLNPCFNGIRKYSL